MRGSRNFRQGGVQVNLTFVLFFFVFFLSSAYSSEVKWLISKKTIIFQGSRGVKLFPGGGGGSNCLFPIETHITCDFPGGVRTPVPPSGSAHVSNLSSIKKTAFTDFKEEFVHRIREKENKDSQKGNDFLG